MMNGKKEEKRAPIREISEHLDSEKYYSLAWGVNGDGGKMDKVNYAFVNKNTVDGILNQIDKKKVSRIEIHTEEDFFKSYGKIRK